MNDNTENKAKTLSEKTLFASKYFKVLQKEIRRKEKTYTKDFVVRSPAVFILPYTPENELYVEYQYRDALGKSVYEVVAGTMEEGGDPLETAKRELHEETGLTAATWKLIATWDLSVNLVSKLYMYAATDLTTGEAHLDEDEELQTIKMPFSEVLEKTMNGQFPSAAHVAGILLFDKLRREEKI